MTSRLCTECGQVGPLQCVSCHKLLCARHFTLHAQKHKHPAFKCSMCGRQDIENGWYYRTANSQNFLCLDCRKKLNLTETYKKFPKQEKEI